jgi:hypothetical protein
MSEKLLNATLQHITLSFDGATRKATNITARARVSRKCAITSFRFCRMKHARGSKMQIVVQMVRMP